MEGSQGADAADVSCVRCAVGSHGTRTPRNMKLRALQSACAARFPRGVCLARPVAAGADCRAAALPAAVVAGAWRPRAAAAGAGRRGPWPASPDRGGPRRQSAAPAHAHPNPDAAPRRGHRSRSRLPAPSACGLSSSPLLGPAPSCGPSSPWEQAWSLPPTSRGIPGPVCRSYVLAVFPCGSGACGTSVSIFFVLSPIERL